MTKHFRELTDALPPKRRDGIERQAQALAAEYELLQALRKDRNVTQQALVLLMGLRQSSVSKIEHQQDMHLSTLRRYVEALGGRLEIRACFDDGDVELDLGALIRDGEAVEP
ncbi:MAG: XRE family transcriptional regulator [Trueperaceae bacterium]|nr:XRE family transcriptional regulator [Trueperaceae bacterium]